MPARDMRKAKEAAERIEAEVPKARLYLAKLDLAEFDSVREFGEHLRQRYGTGSLDLLVNNAGIMALPKRTMNSQGLELQIATNYFGPFLLTALLFPLMKEEEGSRIVTVGSRAVWFGIDAVSQRKSRVSWFRSAADYRRKTC